MTKTLSLLLSIPFTTLLGLAVHGDAFVETNGLVVVEAENFSGQELANLREWEIIGEGEIAEAASGGTFLQVLPDTRVVHADSLRHGLNFSNESGVMAVLSYPVRFSNPGKYYVWVRAWSEGTEDNGIHTGIDDTWPESGRKMQWCEGKRSWRWESRQRTGENHCGEPYKIYLDVPTAGLHTVQFSMREDGFRFDRFLLTLDREMDRPEGIGPPPSPRERAGRQPSTLITVHGEPQTWHAVTLDLTGPVASEDDIAPNPFLHYNFEVEFTHASGSPSYRVPGYFAADGDAAESSATSGNVWRAHLCPDRPGTWHYRILFHSGPEATVGGNGSPLPPYDGLSGSFEVQPTDNRGRDFRGRGRLEYVGLRYLRFAGDKTLFLKMGADAPETLLACVDFDGTRSGKGSVPLKTWSPHLRDALDTDPTWQGGKGRGLLGAINYLAKAGANSISFLTYNAGGDGDNVWPFISRDDKLHYDVSKLDQWNRVFSHAQANGIFLHFKLQENELDDERARSMRFPKSIPTALDGGHLGVERKLYLREIVARFGHHLALNWNLGEENTQSIGEIRDMAEYLKQLDPYDHHIVIHTFPNQQDLVYSALLKNPAPLTGASVQTEWHMVHERTLHWILASERAGRNWVVANDEQGPADTGVPPDPGYEGFDGVVQSRHGPYDLHDIRKETLWGNLMAGGAGVEYYFGYRLPQNDLLCEDFRAREESWKFGSIALEFFEQEKLPLDSMHSADQVVADSPSRTFALVKQGELYLLYSTGGGRITLNLEDAPGKFSQHWFNPRTGESTDPASAPPVRGGNSVELVAPEAAAEEEDWVLLLRRPVLTTKN